MYFNQSCRYLVRRGLIKVAALQPANVRPYCKQITRVEPRDQLLKWIES